MTWWIDRVHLDGDSVPPRGVCPATVSVVRQDSDHFDGSITVPPDVRPPCHPGTFDLTGTVTRHEYRACVWMSDHQECYDATSFRFRVLSDIEPFLHCAFVASDPDSMSTGMGFGQWGEPYRGEMALTDTHGLSLFFRNVYQCGGDRWLISAWAAEQRPTLSVVPIAATLLVGATLQLTAIPKDFVGGDPASIQWRTDAPAVATVSETGLVTALGVGMATITAEAQGVTGTAVITVVAPSTALATFSIQQAAL